MAFNKQWGEAIIILFVKKKLINNAVSPPINCIYLFLSHQNFALLTFTEQKWRSEHNKTPAPDLHTHLNGLIAHSKMQPDAQIELKISEK